MTSRFLGAVLLGASSLATLSTAGLADESATGGKPAGSTADFIGPMPNQSGIIADPRLPYRMLARHEAARLNIPYELIDAVMSVESGYNPLASGRDGEVGLMQIMPQTARLLGFHGTDEALSDPAANIRLGATYLAEAYRLAQADICTTVMKYRAGHRETRFSQRSVTYCLRVRQHLASLGFAVTGEVPPATFGFENDVTRMGIAIGSVAAARRHATGRKLRSRVGWRAYSARINALDAKVKGISLDR